MLHCYSRPYPLPCVYEDRSAVQTLGGDGSQTHARARTCTNMDVCKPLEGIGRISDTILPAKDIIFLPMNLQHQTKAQQTAC
jgi:hypothetical protein